MPIKIKFRTVVEVLDTVFELSDECYADLLIAALMFGHARSASLIHYPNDNYSSLYLVNLRPKYTLR